MARNKLTGTGTNYLVSGPAVPLGASSPDQEVRFGGAPEAAPPSLIQQIDEAAGRPTLLGKWGPDQQQVAQLASGFVGGTGEAGGDVTQGADWLEKLLSAYEQHPSRTVNEMGGQQVDIILPNGKWVSDAVPSHDMMMQRAGIDGTIEDFMAKTGAIRAHGPDNYEMWNAPTNAQMYAIRQNASDNGVDGVQIDAMPAGQSDYNSRVSDYIQTQSGLGELRRFLNQVYGK